MQLFKLYNSYTPFLLNESIGVKMDFSEIPFEFKYLGELPAIDLTTLLATQLYYSTILSEIQDHLYPGVRLQIKIQSFDHNSFDINQLINFSTDFQNLFKNSLENIGSIFSIFSGIIDIHKFLKGRKPESIEQIDESRSKLSVSINGNNNTLVIHPDALKLYSTNPQISKALNISGEILDNDKEVNGIEVVNKSTSHKVLQLSRSEFKDLQNPNPYFTGEDNVIVIYIAELYIRKVDLSPVKSAKWGFVYNGRKINNVTIKDEKFLKKVREGLKFGNGDKLIAELKITQKFDTKYNTYLDKNFEIRKVHNVVFKNLDDSQIQMPFSN